MSASALPTAPDRRLVVGKAVEIADGVRRVLAPNANMMTGPGTNTYLVGASHVACIDPGPADDAHLDAVAEAARGRLRWILVTHTHSDHSPGAVGLAQRTGARLIGFGPMLRPGVEGHDDTFTTDLAVRDGFTIALPGGFVLRAVHTPGHASNHLCWMLGDALGTGGHGLLFSGDHIMDGSTVVIAPHDGRMGEYLASLDRLLTLPMRAIAPGHGHRIDDPYDRVQEYIRHRRSREAMVVEHLVRLFDEQPADPVTGARGIGISALVAAIYVGVPEQLHPVALYSVWAHLQKLAQGGCVETTDRDDITSRWWPAPHLLKS